MSLNCPHIFYSSDLSRAEQWRAALATQFAAFEFSTAANLTHPEEVDVALVWRLPEAGLQHFTRLRAVLSLGAGVNQIDMSRLPPGLPLAKLVDSTLTQQMVEYAMASVYRYHRRLHRFEQASARGEWRVELPVPASECHVAVMGLGTLGLAVAVALRDAGFTVGAWSRSPRQIAGVATCHDTAGLHDLLARSSIVVNLLPLTAQTRFLYDRALFQQMRRGTRLINMGRGEHIVEQALLEALDNGQLEAATLDVFSVEPLPPAHPFWRHPGILVTPHVAGVSSPMTAIATIAENIRRALRGDALLNQVDPRLGY